MLDSRRVMLKIHEVVGIVFNALPELNYSRYVRQTPNIEIPVTLAA